MSRVVLVHGGFHPVMDGVRFWGETGIGRALSLLGCDVQAPDRVAKPRSWSHEAAHLAHVIGETGACHVVAGSNGCSAAARLALEHSEHVRSLTLCWPATRDVEPLRLPSIEELVRSGVARHMAEQLIDAGETLRGCTDAELSALRIPVGIVAPEPPDLAHQQVSVDRLLAAIPGAGSLGAFPIPFKPPFATKRSALAEALRAFICRAEGGTTQVESRSRSSSS